MEKISYQDAQGVLKQAGYAIRTLSRENAELKEKLAAQEKEARIRTLAELMDEKGLNAELTTEEKVAQLSQAKDLDVAEEAIKLAAPQMTFGNLGDTPGNGVHPFEHFIMTGEDPTE